MVILPGFAEHLELPLTRMALDQGSLFVGILERPLDYQLVAVTP